jgi:CheY-like chemotaxis protein
MAQCAILIVEYEYLIHSHAAELIKQAGYEVAEAANADLAIAMLESRSDIRIVFTDIHMPGPVDGLKLTHAIRDRWPHIHIIATGYGIQEGELPERAVFLWKPTNLKPWLPRCTRSPLLRRRRSGALFRCLRALKRVYLWHFACQLVVAFRTLEGLDFRPVTPR